MAMNHFEDNLANGTFYTYLYLLELISNRSTGATLSLAQGLFFATALPLVSIFMPLLSSVSLTATSAPSTFLPCPLTLLPLLPPPPTCSFSFSSLYLLPSLDLSVLALLLEIPPECGSAAGEPGRSSNVWVTLVSGRHSKAAGLPH